MSEPITAKELACEVANSNFKDKRLSARLRGLVTILATNPQASLPRALSSGDLEGAYRFFSNIHVTPELILRPHFQATRARCADEGDFLVVHDSTMFQYRCDGEREGLGRVKRSSAGGKQAFFAHVSLALAADGTRRPLGVTGLKTWIRAPDASGIEYQRWEEQIRSTSAQLNGLKHAIHLMDREADDYQMFDGLIRDRHRFVARSQYNRRLEAEAGNEKLHDLFERVVATVDRQIYLPRRKPKKDPVAEKINPARSMHIATLSVAAATVALKRPSGKRTHDTDPAPTVTLNVVRVWEANPPEGEEGVEWYLCTTEPISTSEEALAIVDYYRARWVIEEYFKTIKSGCHFEKRQLGDYEGLTNLLATFAPIAYRMLLIRSEARRAPDAPAVDLISPDRMDVLRTLGRIKLSANPTNRDVYLAIAALGGYIKRKRALDGARCRTGSKNLRRSPKDGSPQNYSCAAINDERIRTAIFCFRGSLRVSLPRLPRLRATKQDEASRSKTTPTPSPPAFALGTGHLRSQRAGQRAGSTERARSALCCPYALTEGYNPPFLRGGLATNREIGDLIIGIFLRARCVDMREVTAGHKHETSGEAQAL